jgi:hypothetical protein
MKKMIQKILSLVLITYGLWLGFTSVDYKNESRNYISNNSEVFSPNLSSLNTISKIEGYIDSVYNSQNNTFDSFQYFQTIKEVVKKKFYHGNAAYSWRENWICFLLGKYAWSDINSLVSPNEIIKHSTAMCSQQTMVFTRLMSHRGYTYRYVYLKDSIGKLGHFCCDIWLGGDWHFVDVNQEPIWKNIKGRPNQNIETLIEKNKLEVLYKNSSELMHDIKSNEIDISYSPINAKLGLNMILFQYITKWLSWILPISLGAVLFLKSRK